jgi:hypothetical protein
VSEPIQPVGPRPAIAPVDAMEPLLLTPAEREEERRRREQSRERRRRRREQAAGPKPARGGRLDVRG